MLHSERAVSYQTEGLKGKMKIAFSFHQEWEVKQQRRQEGRIQGDNTVAYSVEDKRNT